MLDLATVADRIALHGSAVQASVRPFHVGDRLWDFSKKRYLVGVINLSPDSWYAESVATTTEAAIARGEELLADGADAIDIGAESTLPNAEVLGADRQIDRLRPVVEALAARGAAVSVESYHPEVLEASAKAGARIFNLTGARRADDAFDLARRYDAAVILCYVQGETVRDVSDFDLERDMVPKLLSYFRSLTERAAAKGVSKCFLDPGLGFYYRNLEDGRVRVRHQLDTFLSAFRIAELGYPTFNILPHAPVFFRADERRAAEPFFSVLALLFGTHVLRTHELRTVARIRDLMGAYEPPA